MNDNQITVDSNKMAEKLLNRLATEIWNVNIREVKMEELENRNQQLKLENIKLKQELANIKGETEEKG
ncbi:hypothetical protein [Lactobacillus taiwanensis]|uniref:hypothetical protein n=1 Tax=Lactobacillus taiwanensis TaxID=508451 RepID=UPI00321FB704